MEGYQRSFWYDETSVPWRAPSPNLPDLNSAMVYPGIAILEFLNLSVGRGTEAPFGIVGAPYLDGEHLREHLQERGFAGVRIEAWQFVPKKSRFQGETCGGVRLWVTDRDQCDPLAIAAAMGQYLYLQHPEESGFEEKMNVLVRNPAAIDAIKKDGNLQLEGERESTELTDFLRRRDRWLFYK